MRKLLVWNVVDSGPADFDYRTQQLEDENDDLLKGNSAAVMVAVDADPEAIAAALEVIALEIRDEGLQALHAAADRKVA